MTTPITPDEDTARDWLLQELSKAEYQEAKPNPIDELFNAIWEWFASLFEYTPNGVFGINPAWIFIILGIILLVVLFVIFGRPRAVAPRRFRARRRPRRLVARPHRAVPGDRPRARRPHAHPPAPRHDRAGRRRRGRRPLPR
jgi:hypothetical protein